MLIDAFNMTGFISFSITNSSAISDRAEVSDIGPL